MHYIARQQNISKVTVGLDAIQNDKINFSTVNFWLVLKLINLF